MVRTNDAEDRFVSLPALRHCLKTLWEIDLLDRNWVWKRRNPNRLCCNQSHYIWIVICCLKNMWSSIKYFVLGNLIISIAFSVGVSLTGIMSLVVVAWFLACWRILTPLTDLVYLRHGYQLLAIMGSQNYCLTRCLWNAALRTQIYWDSGTDQRTCCGAIGE